MALMPSAIKLSIRQQWLRYRLLFHVTQMVWKVLCTCVKFQKCFYYYFIFYIFVKLCFILLFNCISLLSCFPCFILDILDLCSCVCQFFDDIKIEDPRVAELCIKAGQPTPYQVLCDCLKRFELRSVMIMLSVFWYLDTKVSQVMIFIYFANRGLLLHIRIIL